MFSKETEDKFKHLASIYPRKRSALIPMLLLAQKEDGYIKPETIEYVGRYLDVNASEVDSIMSFYTLLRRQPAGKYHIMICTNLSCLLQGSDEIEACVKRKLGIGLGEVTPDGLFSAIEFECLASCTTAPVIQINGEFYENLDVRKTEEILDELRKLG
ncbi:MAG TPA: NAD(P)H-dependent oxidoreductase subunit E [Terriglobia bacterium]|nr:NAD(P)H-dependent oxidoreductase subunit E [Terriglobia bacterium]